MTKIITILRMQQSVKEAFFDIYILFLIRSLLSAAQVYSVENNQENNPFYINCSETFLIIHIIHNM